MTNQILFTFLGGDRRMQAARAVIEQAGLQTADWPSPRCTHLVLPLPAFSGDLVREGPPLAQVLPELGPDMTLLGGMLEPHRKTLEDTGAKLLDYYNDETLAAANAEITAEAAVSLAMERLPVTLSGTACLVCGWGRIGQLLARKLAALGARVTVAARKPKDLGMIGAMGFAPLPMGQWQGLSPFRVVFNTVPAPILDRQALLKTDPSCLLIELASGMVPVQERQYIRAGGLPGIYAPETAGTVIGKTILRLTGLSERSDL